MAYTLSKDVGLLTLRQAPIRPGIPRAYSLVNIGRAAVNGTARANKQNKDTMPSQKITTNTPIRLQDAVCEAFAQEYEKVIEEHGAAYAVNYALSLHLANLGYTLGALETPKDRIAAGQTRRWASVKEVMVDAEAETERRRELKRERDRKYRAKRKAQKGENHGE